MLSLQHVHRSDIVLHLLQAVRIVLRPMEMSLMKRSLMRLCQRVRPRVMSGRQTGKAGTGASWAAERAMQSSRGCRSSKQQRLREISASARLLRLLPGWQQVPIQTSKHSVFAAMQGKCICLGSRMSHVAGLTGSAERALTACMYSLLLCKFVQGMRITRALMLLVSCILGGQEQKDKETGRQQSIITLKASARAAQVSPTY